MRLMFTQKNQRFCFIIKYILQKKFALRRIITGRIKFFISYLFSDNIPGVFFLPHLTFVLFQQNRIHLKIRDFHCYYILIRVLTSRK
jgi:hypothetical protein